MELELHLAKFSLVVKVTELATVEMEFVLMQPIERRRILLELHPWKIFRVWKGYRAKWKTARMKT